MISKKTKMAGKLNESFRVYVNILNKQEFDRSSTYEHVTVDDILGDVHGVDPTNTLSPLSNDDLPNGILPNNNQPGSLFNPESPESFSPENMSPTETSTSSTNEEQETCTVLESVDGSPSDKNSAKLCGYLKVHKPSDKNKHRKRWFVFNDETCRLMYFRTPKDFIPRCDIDISTASFFLGSLTDGHPHTFQIRTGDDVFILESANQKTMLYWLQELQRRRKQFSRKRSKTFPLKMLGSTSSSQDPFSQGSTEEEVLAILENISLPRDTVGLQTQEQDSPSRVPFANMKDELRKLFSGLVQQKNRQQSENHIEEGESSLATPTDHTVTPVSKPSGLFSKRPDIMTRLKRRSADGSKEDVGSTGSTATRSSCHRCSAYDDQLSVNKDEIAALEEELLATQEVTRILQKQIDELIREKNIWHRVQHGPPDTTMEILKEQEKTIVNWEHLLATMKEENEILKSTNRGLEAEVDSLREQIAAFIDSLQAKDAVVIKLSEQLHSLETGHTATIPPSRISNQEQHLSAKTIMQKENQSFKDTIAGYKMQNQFLNQEILELNRLRQDDQIREQELLQTCIQLETNYYNEHRKYLSCLKELGKSAEDGPQSVEILQRLLEDAVSSRGQWSSGDGVAPREIPRYDEIGFPLHFHALEHQEDSFDCTLSTMEKQSSEMLVKARSIEDNLYVGLQWERILTNVGVGSTPQRSKEFKYLLRKGIPNHHRPTVWKWCVDLVVSKMKSGFAVNYYESRIDILKSVQHQLSPATKQIELDLLRTLPGNKFFEDIRSDKVQALRRVLQAFNLHDPVVGYCQGLNRIAAIALLFLKEEDAFWCLVLIVNFLLPANYFCSGMMGAHADQRVLSELVQEKLPQLSAHLKQLQVELSMFTFNWFLTVYVDSIPSQMYLRIWDSFLYEGSKVLFRYAIAFLKYKESEIVSIQDTGEMHLFLRSLPQQMIDCNAVAKIAFEEINPFPMKAITSKRQHHLVAVKKELDRVEEQRVRYKQQRAESVFK